MLQEERVAGAKDVWGEVVWGMSVCGMSELEGREKRTGVRAV